MPLTCSAYPDNEAVDRTPAVLPAQELTGQILYQLLLAEIAANRGNMAFAAAAYAELAQSTRDPRIAKRAAEVALYARRPGDAMEMARLWMALDPASPAARQTIIGLLLAAKRLDEAVLQLGELLTLQSEPLGVILPQLQRLLARHADNNAVAEVMEQLTRPYEDHVEAHLARANAYVAAGADAPALAGIERGQQLQPESQQAILLKAQILHRSSDAQAIAALRDFLNRYPKAREVRTAYARILVGERQYEQARQQYETLLEADHNDRDAIYAVALLSLQLRDERVAEREFRRLLELGFAEGNVVRLYLAQIAEDHQRVQEALQWYAQVTAGDQYVNAQVRAATLSARQGKLEAGRELLQKAALSSAKDAIALLIAEAHLLTEAGRSSEAYDLLRQRLETIPEDPQLLYESALLAEKLGRYETFETSLRSLIALKPDHAHAYNALGYSLAERNVRLDEAQALIDKALALAPEDAFILDSQGWVLYRRGDYEAALSALRKAYTLRSDPEIAAHLGEVLWILGRHAEADETWSTASRADPHNAVLAATIKKFKP